MPSHRRRDRKSKKTPLELSQRRAVNGQLLWLGMQCLPQLLARLSLLMAQTPQATMDTIYGVKKLARKATAWAKTPANSNLYLISWHASRLKRVERSSSAVGTKAAANCDDEAVCILWWSERSSVWAARFATLVIGNETNSCCSGGGLSWCLRHLGSLFGPLSWLERQEIWPGSACSQTKSC